MLRLHRWIMSLLARVRPTILANPLLRLLQRHRKVVSYADFRLWITPYNHLGWRVAEGRYEPETERIVRESLRAGGVFVDVGANEGFYCALAARLLGPAGRIVAIEPLADLGEVIGFNVALNGPCRLSVHRAVAGATDGGMVTLNVFPASNPGASSVLRHYPFSRSTQTVPSLTLDTLATAESLDRIDLVKIDVEGYEGEVISGMAGLLSARRVGTLLVDYHGEILERAGRDGSGIDAAIRGHGYILKQGDWHGGFALYSPGPAP